MRQYMIPFHFREICVFCQKCVSLIILGCLSILNCFWYSQVHCGTSVCHWTFFFLNAMSVHFRNIDGSSPINCMKYSKYAYLLLCIQLPTDELGWSVVIKNMAHQLGFSELELSGWPTYYRSEEELWNRYVSVYFEFCRRHKNCFFLP